MNPILIALGIVTAIATNGTPRTPRVVTAEAFHLVDSKGNIVAKIETRNDLPVLAMYGSDGKIKASVEIGDTDTATLKMYGADETPQIILDAAADKPTICIIDPATGRSQVITRDDIASSKEAQAEKTPGLELEKWNRNKNQFSTDIVGTIKNNTGHDLSFVEIAFNAYDKNGNRITTISDMTTYLKKGDSWRFKANSIQEGIETITLKSVMGH